MGIAPTISATEFPRQGSHLGQAVEVCFHYDTSRRFPGKCVRDDADAPHVTAFLLEDGRLVLATECQYALVSK